MATINGTNGNDDRNGTAAADTMYMKGGDDTAAGGGGSDTIYGGDGADWLRGEAGDDVLYGGAGQDFLVGEGGDDTLNGDGGRDQLNGGAGRDVLVASAGGDALYGEGGGDFFRFDSVADGNGTTIGDYDRSVDLIDLRKIDANWNRAGDQAYEFIGEHAFTGHAGELRYGFPDGRLALFADNDGDGQADMRITVLNVQSLGFSDFLL